MEYIKTSFTKHERIFSVNSLVSKCISKVFPKGLSFGIFEKSSDQIPDSLVLIENDRVFFKSTAALKIAKRMDGLWPLFYMFIIIPEPIRNFFYDQIAKHRYRIFGRKESCMMPSLEIESRFL